ncbi:MAG: DNA polymerase III subunit delta' [Curvibacter sp.]|nr:MAG: DNA polymerase III subunit delta' [Curvibacter sp.]
MTGLSHSHAPWIQRQTELLLAQRGHAWLLQGPSGLGQYTLALSLAKSWLCESPGTSGACGICGSCHAIEVRTHADLCVLMPETYMMELQWPMSEKAQAEIDDKKRKPSKEIRVDAMRDAVEFAQRTSARGRGKVVLVFPAEDMNHVTANALLKTLEEPVGDVRFVLASESAHQLLPTIRSRCISHTMQWPSAHDAQAWLLAEGMQQGSIPLAMQASGGRPDDAMAIWKAGGALEDWPRIPAALKNGDLSVWKDWSVGIQIDAAHKLCHDLMALHVDAEPRFFHRSSLQGIRPDVRLLSEWAKALAHSMKTMDHPFNAGLMTETLVSQAQTVLNSKDSRKP